jgi:hypothetical protein
VRGTGKGSGDSIEFTEARNRRIDQLALDVD